MDGQGGISMQSNWPWLCCVLAGTVSGGLAWSQNSAGSTPKGEKVCVAEVANSSMRPIFTGRVKQRLVEDLQKGNINAYDAYAVTALAKELGVSGGNKIVMRREKCNYLLLSEVARPMEEKGSQAADAKPESSIKRPLLDRVSINFTLFKKGQLTAPVLASTVTTAPANDLTEAALLAMDNIASQLVQYFPKQ
jgi:hypothetical protein